MGQTFDPLPEGARIRSEKDGERRIEFKNGIVAHELSEEKIKNQPYYTPEQIRNAILAEIIVPDAPQGYFILKSCLSVSSPKEHNRSACAMFLNIWSRYKFRVKLRAMAKI
jgi:hypothetical protein